MGYCRIVTVTISVKHILCYLVLSSACTVRLLLVVVSILSLASLRGSALHDSSVESAQRGCAFCGTHAGGRTVRSAVTVDSEMRD